MPSTFSLPQKVDKRPLDLGAYPVILLCILLTQPCVLASRYFVAVHNKRTKTTTIREAPLHILTHQVKALKSLKPAEVSNLQRLEARAALGESFGTKKAKQAIKAQERNKVDASAMETVADHLQERIQRNTQALPSRGTFPPIALQGPG